MPEIEFVIRRHGQKSPGGEVVPGLGLTEPDYLSPKGFAQAVAAGAEYKTRYPGKKVILLRRTSDQMRTRQTALGIKRGAGSAVIHTAPLEHPNFSMVELTDEQKWKAAGAKLGEDGLTRLFLTGADIGASETWKEVAQRYFNGVRNIYWWLQHELKKPDFPKADVYVVDITTHGPGVGALASHLLGERTRRALLRRSPERFTEGVRIVIKGARVKAIFRNRSRDITRLL